MYDAEGKEPKLSRDKYGHRDWKAEYDNRYKVTNWAQEEEREPNDIPGGMSKVSSIKLEYKAIVSLIYTNSMIVDTTICSHIHEFVCDWDIEDFISMQQHHDHICGNDVVNQSQRK